MTIQYSIDEDDYLTFQLFTASRSAVIRKRRFRTKILFPALYIIFGAVLLAEQKTGMSIAFFGLALVWYFLYPIRDRRIYRMNYLNYIRQNLKDAFGNQATIRFEKQYIVTKDQIGETKFPLADLEEVAEIPSAIYIKLKSGQTLILPKEKLDFTPNSNSGNTAELTARLKEITAQLNVNYYNASNWRWK